MLVSSVATTEIERQMKRDSLVSRALSHKNALLCFFCGHRNAALQAWQAEFFGYQRGPESLLRSNWLNIWSCLTMTSNRSSKISMWRAASCTVAPQL